MRRARKSGVPPLFAHNLLYCENSTHELLAQADMTYDMNILKNVGVANKEPSLPRKSKNVLF